MAARRNDTDLRRQAIRMSDAGMGCWAIGAVLGIAGTTVRWYVNRRDEVEVGHVPATTHTLDCHGEKVSTSPGRITYACPSCGTRALEPAGHEHCRRVAA